MKLSTMAVFLIVIYKWMRGVELLSSSILTAE